MLTSMQYLMNSGKRTKKLAQLQKKKGVFVFGKYILCFDTCYNSLWKFHICNSQPPNHASRKDRDVLPWGAKPTEVKRCK